MTSLLSCSNTDGSFRLLKMKEEDQNTFMRTLKTWGNTCSLRGKKVFAPQTGN